jgi:acyl carrier protein
LPMTPNGKLDRRALPAPEATMDESLDPPQEGTESMLAELWCDLLGVQGLSRNHNFFAVGGHSLHGMRLVVRIEQRFGVSLAVMAIFQYPTIAEMAAVIDELRAADEQLIEGTIEYEHGVIAELDVETRAAQ